MTFTNVTTTILPDAFLGVPYEASVSVNGATAAQLTLSAGTTQTNKQALPTGLAYGTDGRITGTPTVAGVYNLSIKVADGTSTKDNIAFTLNVHAASIQDAGGLSQVTSDPGFSEAAVLTRAWPPVQ